MVGDVIWFEVRMEGFLCSGEWEILFNWNVGWEVEGVCFGVRWVGYYYGGFVVGEFGGVYWN